MIERISFRIVYFGKISKRRGVVLLHLTALLVTQKKRTSNDQELVLYFICVFVFNIH